MLKQGEENRSGKKIRLYRQCNEWSELELRYGSLIQFFLLRFSLVRLLVSFLCFFFIHCYMKFYEFLAFKFLFGIFLVLVNFFCHLIIFIWNFFCHLIYSVCNLHELLFIYLYFVIIFINIILFKYVSIVIQIFSLNFWIFR